MSLLRNEVVSATISRTYHIHVPDNPGHASVPAIVVFHGGGQNVATIAARWGVDPPAPIPAGLADYLLVFPEADRRLGDEWVHLTAGASGLPTYDLEFVGALLTEITTRAYPTGSCSFPEVSADPAQIYAAGFSNGAGMVWQLVNSDLVTRFRGYAAVGKALDPEKADAYRKQVTDAGGQPVPVSVMYVHGTGDRGYRPPSTQYEVPLDTTLPAYTVQEMLDRNTIPTNQPAVTTLAPGSADRTEVVTQLYQGAASFAQVTVINGGHNWPTPGTHGNPPVATHFDATQAIVEFWRTNAGLR
jgi:poly(3-hydroxybutyrate) depolymerase